MLLCGNFDAVVALHFVIVYFEVNFSPRHATKTFRTQTNSVELDGLRLQRVVCLRLQSVVWVANEFQQATRIMNSGSHANKKKADSISHHKICGSCSHTYADMGVWF